MQVVANGRAVEVPEGTTLAGLIERLGFGQRWVVVERNGAPVERGSFEQVRLSPGDVLEVVRPVQGGQAVLGEGA